MLDQSAEKAARHNELMALPIHQTRDAGPCCGNAFYVGSVRSAIRAAVGSHQHCVETFITFVANVSWRSRPRRFWLRFDTVVAATAAMPGFRTFGLACRTLHRKRFSVEETSLYDTAKGFALLNRILAFIRRCQ